MALTQAQKDMLRTRVKAALDDPQHVLRAGGYKSLRVSDPATGYSLRNTLLLLFQAEERGLALSLCAGFREWEALGRKVRKGEAGLFITAYSPGKRGEDGDESRAYFGGTYVWDVSQTEPLTGGDNER